MLNATFPLYVKAKSQCSTDVYARKSRLSTLCSNQFLFTLIQWQRKVMLIQGGLNLVQERCRLPDWITDIFETCQKLSCLPEGSARSVPALLVSLSWQQNGEALRDYLGTHDSYDLLQLDLAISQSKVDMEVDVGLSGAERNRTI